MTRDEMQETVEEMQQLIKKIDNAEERAIVDNIFCGKTGMARIVWSGVAGRWNKVGVCRKALDHWLLYAGDQWKLVEGDIRANKHHITVEFMQDED